MQSFSDSARSVSESSPPGDGGWSADPYGRSINQQSVIQQANTIPLTHIIAHYGQRVDDYERKIRCPFHKGGNERTPSMWVYPETNSFHCFGCKVSGKSVEFVGKSEKISRFDASLFIIEKWGHLIGDVAIPEDTNHQQEALLMEFSNHIRNFLRKNESADALEYAEKLCFGFDKICQKHQLNADALRSLIEKIKKRLELYA